MNRHLFPNMLMFLVLSVAGSQIALAQVAEGALWRDAVITELDVDFGSGFHARWRFHRCDCGDVQVMVEQVAPDDMLTGELLMVDGQVLLSRGFEQQGEDIEPLIQAPSLMLQLAYSMLNRSQPEGPAAVNEKQNWRVNEKTMDFHLDTGLATGVFGAPWGVKGKGWVTEQGHIRFDLTFRFTNSAPGQPRETGSIKFSGDLDFGDQDFPYSADDSFEGWRVQWISLNELRSKPAEEGLTLEALREKARNPSGG